MELTYRAACKSELDTALSLLKEAAEWLNEKGINYWQEWLEPTEYFRSWIEEGFANNQVCFVENHNRIVGMYRLQYTDEQF